MVTLKDVAEEVGVSATTVSYVLNGKGSVSKKVRNRILGAVKRLGYRPNRMAQAMRTGRTRSIGLVLPDLTNPFFPELAQKVLDAARTEGYMVVLVDSQNLASHEGESFALLDQQGVDGILWCPSGDTAPKQLAMVRCPVVLIDRPLPGFDVVHSDYRTGGELLARYAISLGHKMVGLLSGPQELESARLRRDGFLEAAGDKIDVVWDIEVPFSSELTGEARGMLDARDATLVVAGDDLIAVGVLDALNEAGRTVPDDVSLLGFDDIPWATVIRPQLTTIRQPIAAIGTEAVTLLTRKLLNPNAPLRKIILEVALVERGSARKL